MCPQLHCRSMVCCGHIVDGKAVIDARGKGKGKGRGEG